jgi:hypothetical protein
MGGCFSLFRASDFRNLDPNFEYLALHWLWRAQQKLKSATAPQIAERLMIKYPVTLSWLRARAELNNGKLSFDSGPVSPLSRRSG